MSPRVDHGGTIAQQMSDLNRRLKVAEAALAPGDHAALLTVQAQLAATTASLSALAAQVHAASAFPIGVPVVVVPPAPGPVEIAAIPSVSENMWGPDTQVLARCGFNVPAGSHSMTIVANLTVETHYWYVGRPCDAWLELSGPAGFVTLATGRVRTVGTAYLQSITANLSIGPVTLPAGQYEAHWVQTLDQGNIIRIVGGSVHVWLNN
jgi:hypothetical protein